MQGYGSYYGHGSVKEKDAVAVEMLKGIIAGSDRTPGDWSRDKIRQAVEVAFDFAEIVIERSRDER